MNKLNVKNIINNTKPKAIGYRGLLWILLYLVIAFIISYTTVMTIKYLTTNCLIKENWFKYIFKFCYNDACKTPTQQIIGSINYKETIPPGALPDFKPAQSLDQVPKNSIPVTNVAPEKVSNKSNPAVEFKPRKKLEKPQVFHISNQDYSYQQAKCKCGSYGARLATYSEIVDAYNKGAEWCSYGWSEGQSAYYPTQKCNWLKKSPEDRKACGKPGINGGYFPDAKLRFGANCYGRKPEGSISKIEEQTCDYCELQPDFGASHKLDTDQIAPFNKDRWSL